MPACDRGAHSGTRTPTPIAGESDMRTNQRESNAHDVCDDALPAHTASRRLKCRKQACQQLRPHRQHMYQHQCRGRGRGRRTASNGLQAMLGHQAGSYQSRKHMDMWTECSIHVWEMWSYEVCARLQRRPHSTACSTWCSISPGVPTRAVVASGPGLGGESAAHTRFDLRVRRSSPHTRAATL